MDKRFRMNTNGWNEFELRIPVKADLQTLYDAWSTSEGIEKWFLRSARFVTEDGRTRKMREFVKKDDQYEWLWHGYGDEALERNRILEANGKDFIQFGFAGKCVVSVSIRSDGTGSMVTLRQEQIPEDNNPATNLFVGCQLGWTFYLTNLKSILEGGIDLRNRDEKIGRVITA